jgi:hypothetical protein
MRQPYTASPPPGRGPEEQQVLPIAYARHQPDSQQIGEGKDSGRLAMTGAMDRIRLNAQIGFHEPVNDLDGFLHARRKNFSTRCWRLEFRSEAARQLILN